MTRVTLRRGSIKTWTVSLAIFACVANSYLRAESADGAGVAAGAAVGTMASELARASDAPGGVCAVVGAPDADLALALAKQGSFVVQCLCRDKAHCDQMRKAIRAQGVYGAVSADMIQGGRLPYAENLVNVLAVDSYPAMAAEGVSPEEAMRVLAPFGVAYLGTSSKADGSSAWIEPLAAKLRSMGMAHVSVVKTGGGGGAWVAATKPWPADIDEWGHYLHGADGNPVANDRVVGPPKRLQWVSDPLYMISHETDSSISTIVTSRGRLFYIENQAPISLEGDRLPDKWFLVARDAFNGVFLWKRPIEDWGWRAWKNTWFAMRPGDIPLNVQKRLVAAGDKVYATLGYRAPVSEVDARSGKVLQTYAGTERTGEILYLNGALVLSVLSGDRLKVMAVDAATGKQLWASKGAYSGSTVDYIKWNTSNGKTPIQKLDPALNMATDGKVVAFIDGPAIVCLDFKTGAEKWRAKFPPDEADAKAGGVNSQGALWIGAMIVSDGVVVQASPSKLAGLDANTGKVLWSQPKKFLGHLWYEWKDVFVIDGLVWTWSAELEQQSLGTSSKVAKAKKKNQESATSPKSANGYDIHTGELKKQVPVGSAFIANHHHRCYRDKATVRYILASRRGSEYISLEGGTHTLDNWARGTCHVGMMPANGLQYATPHACQCYIEEKLNGMNALAPAPPASISSISSIPPLERGPAYGAATSGPDAGAENWPAFRANSARSAFVNTKVADDLKPLWQTKAGARVSPPIVVAGRLYASLVDEHRVACLDAKDGKRLWEFAAGARIDSPPAYCTGALLFGSADGWVYCLRASDGQLAWRFHAAPGDRLVGAFGQLESAWPVHGSVLAQNGTAYFAAGRSSHLDGGLYVYGVDIASGKLLHQTKLEGPSYTVDNLKINSKPAMGALPDIMMGDGSEVYMRSVSFDANLKQQSDRPALQTKGGFLDDSYFKRAPWLFDGNYANVIAYDSQTVYYVRMFDSLQGLTPTVFFAPGAKGYQLFARKIGGKRDDWAGRIPMRARAMALTNGRLFVAGPPDVVDPKDPLGAFEGRKGGLLYVIDPASGKKLAEQTLPSPPVFNGIAAANGRLYLADENGAIACLGRQ